MSSVTGPVDAPTKVFLIGVKEDGSQDTHVIGPVQTCWLHQGVDLAPLSQVQVGSLVWFRTDFFVRNLHLNQKFKQHSSFVVVRVAERRPITPSFCREGACSPSMFMGGRVVRVLTPPPRS